MTQDVVREIVEKKRSAVYVMESGEQFWITRSQMAERETIEPGQEIDTDELRQWLLPRQYPVALNDAVALLAQRAHASGEIAQKLRRKLYMEDTIEMVLYKLEKERLLDDEAFAREWAASRARSQIGQQKENGAGKHGCRQQALMIGPGDHPRHMGHDQPHKADASADGHTHADEHGDRDEDRQLHAAHVHADVARIVLPDGKGIELTPMAHDHPAAQQQRQREDARMRVVRAGHGAHRPEGDGAHLIIRKGDDQVDGAGCEHGEDHADEDDAVGGERPVQRVRQREDQQ